MLQKKLSNISNSTLSEHLKKIASARNFFIATSLLLTAVAFVAVGAYVIRKPTVELRFGTQVVHVEVAKSETERQKGLSGRLQLDADRGMLFVFDKEAKWAMWMKDMRLPLDIIWLDSDKKVVHMALDVRPESYPAYFAPQEPARYVVELASGTVHKFDIKPGMTIQFNDETVTK